MQKIGDIPNTRADSNGEFTDGNVAGGIPPTILPAEWFNTIQRELMSILNAAEIESDPHVFNQVLLSIQKLVSEGIPDLKDASLTQKGIVQLSNATNSTSEVLAATPKAVRAVDIAALKIANNLSEIKDAGPAAVAQTLLNLGLGIRGLSTFTASGSWTCPEGVTTVYIDACGGGGGGAYSSPGATGGGGGGGAAAVIGASISVTPGVTYTVTIGGPGAAGTSSSVNGVAGGATSFGSLLVLNGGGGGLSSAGAGVGGGTGGNAGTAGVLNGGLSFGGSGGGCVLGNGGAGGSGAMFGTIPGQYGGGGGGGANGGSGARGAYGILKLRW
ncbi:TPA: phage tail protein [Yersinia enterocolitica]